MSVELYTDNTVCCKFVDFYEEFYSDKSGLTFLDIGSGKGPFSKYIAGKGNKVVAVDINNELPCSKKIMSIRADIFKIDFVPNSFDCVIDNCCLQVFDLDQVVKFMQKIRGWIKPGGRFYAKMAAKSPYYARVKSRLTTEDDIKKMVKGFDGQYSIWTSPLGTGEVANHYIVSMVKCEG